MSHTLAAVFDNRADAERARNELIGAGIGAGSIQLNASGPGTATAASDSSSHEQSLGDSIKHFFTNLFGDDDSERAVYGEAVNRGKTVLTVEVPTQDEVERAADIVERCGPIDIDEQRSGWEASGWNPAQARGAGTSSTQASASRQSDTVKVGAVSGVGDSQQGLSTSGSMQRAQADEQVLPVVQEELKVGKRSVERGGVRIYSRVVETPVTESVQLREEHVHVERHPVDRAIDPAQAGAFKETSFELRENAEEAVVQKTARVVEEVVVGREATQRTQQVSDTLRRTEVDVEQLGSTVDEDYYRSHWTTNFASAGGTYDDYAPAYRYGTAMRGSDTYRNRSWDDSESTLRSNWESRYPQSTWEKFKAAVRHGWDRITS
jgi:uncharacterized protein (TIGR02271 family)